MSQLLASLSDIEAYTDAPVSDELVAVLQVQAYRTIRSQLSVVYPPVELASWSNPDSTPSEIRAIAGELIAAYLLGNQDMYEEAIGKVKAIVDGTV